MSGGNAGAGPQAGGGPDPNDGVATSGATAKSFTATPLLPFMLGLSLPDFSKLINNPIFDNLGLPTMPNNLPSYIPKFEGNAREDPTNHIHSFYMWCSSNSITDDSIHLWLFQCTLTRDAAMWYVDEAAASHSIFSTLAKEFLSYFQLPLCYDTGTNFLSAFHQTSATCLSDHVQ